MSKKIFILLLAFIMAASFSVTAFATDDELEIMLADTYNQGDVNRDTKINIKDVTIIQKYLAKIEPLLNKQISLADVDGINGVNIKDVTYLQKWIAKIYGQLKFPTTLRGSTPATDDSPIILPFVPAL